MNIFERDESFFSEVFDMFINIVDDNRTLVPFYSIRIFSIGVFLKCIARHAVHGP